MVICFTVIILRHLNKRRVIILCCFKKKYHFNCSCCDCHSCWCWACYSVGRAVWLDGCYRDYKTINEGIPCKIADISSWLSLWLPCLPAWLSVDELTPYGHVSSPWMNLGTLAVQGETTTALQLYWLLRVWLLHRTGHHSRRQTQYYFVLSSIYQTLNISFGGTVVRTTKLLFFCVFVPAVSHHAQLHGWLFTCPRAVKGVTRCQRFHHTPVHAEKEGSACKWNTQTLYLFIPALSKSALLDSQLYFL